jgi:hypothetical protein
LVHSDRASASYDEDSNEEEEYRTPGATAAKRAALKESIEGGSWHSSITGARRDLRAAKQKGCQGITITKASVVVMLGVGCNHFRDHQVLTQVYREGQTWDVKVICLVSKNKAHERNAIIINDIAPKEIRGIRYTKWNRGMLHCPMDTRYNMKC